MTSKRSKGKEEEELLYFSTPQEFKEYLDPRLKVSKWDKLKSNPFPAIGIFGATIALLNGVRIFASKKHAPHKQQGMMTARVAAQGFAVIGVIGGLAWHSFKLYRKRLDKEANKEE